MNLNPNISFRAPQVISPDGQVYAIDSKVRIPSDNIIFAVKMGSGAAAVWHLILKENWKVIVNNIDDLTMDVDNPLKERNSTV